MINFKTTTQLYSIEAISPRSPKCLDGKQLIIDENWRRLPHEYLHQFIPHIEMSELEMEVGH